MRTSRLLRATASVAVLILSVPAQSNSASVESAATERCALTGRVLLPSGAPAASAVVVTSAGGQVATKDDGSFELVIDVPRDVESVQLTAVAGSNLVATARVAWDSSSGITDAGPLVLAAATSCEPSWLPTFGPSTGTSGQMRCLTVFDDGSGPALYAGGAFFEAGGVSASCIAKWNGAAWSSLVDGTHSYGMNYYVDALAVFDDGSGPALYAGGEFTIAGGVAGTSYIAKWNGATFSPLGSGMNSGGSVRALAVFDDGSGPALYAGGQFRFAGGVGANHIAKWNGASWSPLGSGISGAPSASVYALVVFDDGSGPALYAGGVFGTAGGVNANNIAKWNGSTWSPLGGVNSSVWALTVCDDGSGPALYAGGTFTTAGSVAASNIAKWNGAIWSPLGSGTSAGVNALTVFDGGSGPALYAGGNFTIAGGMTASHIAQWNGATWAPLGIGIGSSLDQVFALAVFDAGSGPALYVGGRFTTAGGGAASNIAEWNGATWSSFGSGMNDDVDALTVFDDGSGPALYAGGNFTIAGGATANRIAKWNGVTWEPLGGGVNSTVAALTVFDDGSGPALYAGGAFTIAGGVFANSIARWNGTSWTSVGGGMNQWVSSLTVFDDGNGPALYAGGAFTTAGGVAASKIAKWNGESWSSLGSGMNDFVLALAGFDDGSGPALYAAGSFTTAGGVAAIGLAKWNGATWAPLESGLNGNVLALTAFDDGSGPALYAGGRFSSPAGDSFAAKWGCSLPAGARTYGVSSPGCAGALAIGVTSSPAVGNAGFAMTCSNTPPSMPGAFFAGIAFMAPLPILGIQIWVSPIVSLGIASSASGSTAIPLPLPPDPTLVGGQFDVQTIWLGPTSPPPCPANGLSASNALELTIQP